MKGESPFIPVKEVLVRLNVSNYNRLDYISDLLLHMRFLQRRGRFYAKAYIEAYAAWLRQNNLAATRPSAQKFANLPSTQQLISELTSGIEECFRVKPWLRRKELCDLMGITSKTVGHWYRADALMGQQTPTEQSYFGQQQVWTYSADSLRGSLEWRVPRVKR